MQKLLGTVSVLFSINCLAQEKHDTSYFDLTGYVETYYLFDFNKPANHSRPDFVYSYNRANEFNLNLGVIKGAYATTKLRANLALMAGTYANANLRNEPGVLKNIFEANAGVKLSPRQDIWLDAGIFASHIGFESAVGKDAWNLTRSILADNSPYFESGLKFTYTTSDGVLLLSGLLLNGWQRIQMPEGNSLPSFGTQVTFKSSAALTLNYSSFIGSDTPDSARLMRYFNNFYGVFRLSEKVGLTLGMDYGLEEKENQDGFNIWFSPIIIFRVKSGGNFSTAWRAEYYVDKKEVIIPTGSKIASISLNVDYQIASNAVARFEVRHFTSDPGIFTRDEKKVNNNLIATTSLVVSF